MPQITGSVGAGGTNAVHDVALVQMMLTVIRRKTGTSYFGHDYTVPNPEAVRKAILAFQTDKSLFASAPGGPAHPPRHPSAAGNAPAGDKRETPGLVEPGSRTWRRLLDSLPDAYNSVRTLEGTSLAYFPMEKSRESESIADIHCLDIRQDLELKLVSLVREFYKKSEIALSVVPGSGWRRTF